MPVRILIIEDDAMMSELIGVWIERAGWEPVPVTSLADALSAQAAGPVGAVITDHELGADTTGIDALDALRANQPGLVAVVMSGYPERHWATLVPTDQYRFFQKPFHPDALIDYLAEALGDPRVDG